MELTLEEIERAIESAARATSTISREENRKRFWTGSMVMRWKAAETGELPEVTVNLPELLLLPDGH